jgi:hypothetical protein
MEKRNGRAIGSKNLISPQFWRILHTRVLRIMRYFIWILPLFLFTSFADTPPAELSGIHQDSMPRPYPQGYFQSPVAGTLRLSGTFGELRPNHFHAGIDIAPTTGGQEPIFAAADGYVARIRVQEGGYGQALYIAHPAGFTTVYGHLEKFNSDITDFLRKKQTETESFEQDLILQAHDLPIKQGQQIANMGNRGHSFGQHLHFEIRDTKTEKAINPLLFGFAVADNVPPTMGGLKLYLMDEKKEILGTRYLSLVKKASGEYGIAGDTLDIGAAHFGFALKTSDRHSGDSGDNGIYSIALTINDLPVYHFSTETFSFDETRYINAHMDYYEQHVRRSYYHRLFRLAGNKLGMYMGLKNDGIGALTDTTCQKINIAVHDVAGNAAHLAFYLRPQAQVLTPAPKPYTYVFPYDKENVIKPDAQSIFHFPENCFYETVLARFQTSHTEGGQFSPTYHLHDRETPVHAPFTVAIRPTYLPDDLRDKAYIAYCVREDSRIYTLGGKWDENGFLKTKSANFGNFCIKIDTVPPTITPVSFSSKMARTGRMSFRIRDNIEGMPLKYRAELDGKWLLMEVDGKSDLLYCKFENSGITEGVEHELKIALTDSRGNTRIFEDDFELVDHIEKPRKTIAKVKKKRRK